MRTRIFGFILALFCLGASAQTTQVVLTPATAANMLPLVPSFEGTYVPTNTYKFGDWVVNGSGCFFVSLAANNTGNPLPNPPATPTAYWISVPCGAASSSGYSPVAPTWTALSGSGTYTPPAGTLWLEIRMCGAGGAGGSSGTAPAVGTAGTASTFGTLTAAGGSPATGTATGQPRIGGLGGAKPTLGAFPVAGGNGASVPGGQTWVAGAAGAAGPFGDAGSGGDSTGSATSAGSAGGPCSGGGGAGAAGTATAGAGGGAGAYLEQLLTAASYNYVVGAGGTPGAAGTGGFIGGPGGPGLIFVKADAQ